MPKKTPEKPDPNKIHVVRTEDEDEAEALAKFVLRPSVQNSITVREYTASFGEVSVDRLIEELGTQIDAANEGDLRRGESMLTAQAHTLDAIFNNLARRALNAEYMKNLDTYLKLALRAQSQCRATWEAISTIKHPPMVGYVGQANISNGPQQVNNGALPGARKNEDPQNELLEHNDGERLDAGTARTASGTDQLMAPLGKVDRPEDA